MNHNEHQPNCPKCAYDLTGEIATWETQCPLQGVCSECGHAFAWSEPFRILNEWGSEVDWYAEHAHSLRTMLRRTPGTVLRLVFPSRFYKDVNHRRRVRPVSLAVWVIAVTALLHILVSPIGALAHHVEGIWFPSTPSKPVLDIFAPIINQVLSALVYPFGKVYLNSNGLRWTSGPFQGYEWADYMKLALACVGVIVFWVGLITFAMLVRAEKPDRVRADLKLLARIVFLNLLAIALHIQIVRVCFGIHVANNWEESTIWVYIVMIVSAVVLMFWQQLLWTHAVRRYWHIRRSFLINVGGCFGSVIFGIGFMIWMM